MSDLPKVISILKILITTSKSGFPDLDTFATSLDYNRQLGGSAILREI